MHDSEMKNKRIITPKSGSFAPGRRFSKFYCWSCGLSQGDAELCVRCPYKTHAVNEVTA